MPQKFPFSLYATQKFPRPFSHQQSVHANGASKWFHHWKINLRAANPSPKALSNFPITPYAQNALWYEKSQLTKMLLFSRHAPEKWAESRTALLFLCRALVAVNLKSINFTAAVAFFARNVQINYTRELKHKIAPGDKKTGGGAHHSLTREFRDTSEMKKRRLSALVNFDVVHIPLLTPPSQASSLSHTKALVRDRESIRALHESCPFCDSNWLMNPASCSLECVETKSFSHTRPLAVSSAPRPSLWISYLGVRVTPKLRTGSVRHNFLGKKKYSVKFRL
jgi:hypothetical protein